MIKSLFVSVLTIFSLSATAETLDQYGIVRNDDGSVHAFSQLGAQRVCPEGTHLPTIRELAQLSELNGSKGIADTDENPDGDGDGWYGEVIAWDMDSNKAHDHFFFSAEGYKRPATDLGNYWFWSSSFYPGGRMGYCLSGMNGDVITCDRNFIYTVMCIAN